MRILTLALLLLISCSTARKPYSGNLQALLASNPLADGEKVKIIPLAQSPRANWQVIRLRVSVPAHVHKKSDETVQILAGRGILRVGKKRHQVKTGDVYVIPMGTEHEFILESPQADALSTFTPRFSPGDRIYTN
jgi:mannose-6-phosphate isomerase-like protein (cupin superfamily)